MGLNILQALMSYKVKRKVPPCPASPPHNLVEVVIMDKVFQDLKCQRGGLGRLHREA